MGESCCSVGEEEPLASSATAASLKFGHSSMWCCDIQLQIVVLAIIIVLFSVFGGKNKNKNNRPGKQTLRLLTEKDEMELNCKSICEAFLNMPVVDGVEKCAEQMRQLLKGRYLLYNTLETNPEYLLRATRHLSIGDHGALATRFTVQYNLFAGSVVAMGTETQRNFLYNTQEKGELGCFAFTELGAGVLSGAGVETTATFHSKEREFYICSPSDTATKTWISQGCYAEHAVILASLIMPDGSDKGPHLFFARIQHRNPETGAMTPVDGVTVSSLDSKIALQSLDNAYIRFDDFRVSKGALLSRFSSIDEETGIYQLALPKGSKRMLDILISRLLTGRVCLSEYTLLYSNELLKESYNYACNRDLWISKRHRGEIKSNKMCDKPLIAATFTKYVESIAVIAAFIANTRETTAVAIQNNSFSPSLVEAVCISKFVGTSFGVDTVSVMRKMMGSQAMFAKSRLGASSFVCNATCAAEGDNTIMELKVVGDLIKGGIGTIFPLKVIIFAMFHNSVTRYILWIYVTSIAYAFYLGRNAMAEGQLLRDIAWARAHLLILKDLRIGRAGQEKFSASELDALERSYADVLVKFPVPPQF